MPNHYGNDSDGDQLSPEYDDLPVNERSISKASIVTTNITSPITNEANPEPTTLRSVNVDTNIIYQLHSLQTCSKCHFFKG